MPCSDMFSLTSYTFDELTALTFIPRMKSLNVTPRKGFTLIELLTVIGIIGILASVLIVAGGAVRQQQLVSRTRGELSTIANALEKYKSVYGDYPWLGPDSDATGSPDFESAARNSQELYDALTGQLAMRRNPTSGNVQLIDLQNNAEAASRSFLDAEAMQVINDDFMVDPWGNPYYYFYIATGGDPVQSRNAWTRSGFILLSAGPDGLFNAGQFDRGVIPSADDYRDGIDADNIVYGIEY